MPLTTTPALFGGRRKTRRSGMSVKALKRALKKAGLKTSGRKSALTKRAKKAHLMRGGDEATGTCVTTTTTTKADCAGEWTESSGADAVADGPPPPGLRTNADGIPEPEGADMGGRHRRGHRGSRKSRSRKH